MNEQSEYDIKLRDLFTGPLARIEDKLNAFEKKVNRVGGTGLGAVFGGVTLANAFETASGYITSLSSKIVELGANMERTKLAFGVLLGSTAFANQEIAKYQEFAKNTPFSTTQVLQGAKLLTAYGFAAEQIIPTMRTLGDVTSALNLNFEDMVWLYGTTKTEGYAMRKDLRQFQLRGINLLPELAKQFGLNEGEEAKILDLASKRKVTFQHIEKALQSMTSKGAQFGGLMDVIAKSVGGRWERFKDTLEIMATSLGERILPTLGGWLDFASSKLDSINNADFSNLLGTVDALGDGFNRIYDTLDRMFGFGETSIFGEVLDSLLAAVRAAAFLLENVLLAIEKAGKFIDGLFAKDFTSLRDTESFSSLWERMIARENEIENNSRDRKVKFAFGVGRPAPEVENPRKKPNTVFGEDDSDVIAKRKKTMDDLGGTPTATSTAGIERIQAGSRNITVNIAKLVGEIQFTKNYEQSEAKLIEMIKKALVGAVNDVNLVAD